MRCERRIKTFEYSKKWQAILDELSENPLRRVYFTLSISLVEIEELLPKLSRNKDQTKSQQKENTNDTLMKLQQLFAQFENAFKQLQALKGNTTKEQQLIVSVQNALRNRYHDSKVWIRSIRQ